MKYKELNVSFRKPKIWRKPFVKTLTKKRRYMEIIKEIVEFDNLKKDAKKEISINLDKALEMSNSKGQLSRNMSDLFEFYGKGVVLTDELDDEFLLKKTNKNTLNKKLQPWCGNMAFNIPRVVESPPLLRLFKKFKDAPAFVILAGPSLKNNIKELKKVGDKGIVIATDTAFRPCLEAGVKVHLVMAHDANPQGMRFFLPKDHKYQDPKIRFNDMPVEVLINNILPELHSDLLRLKYKYDAIGVFVNYAHPLTIEAFNGSELCFYQVVDPSLPVYSLMGASADWRKTKDDKFIPEPKGFIVGGSSVGHTAVYLALNLGCNPISILGCDLSYPGGKTYIEGASNQKDASTQKLIEVEDLSGRKVGTNLSMFSYKMVFERSLPKVIEMAPFELQFFNCTEHEDGSPAGILEAGAEPRRLKDVISEYCKEDLENIKNILKIIQTEKEGENKDARK